MALPLYSSRDPISTAYDLYARGSGLLRDGHPHAAVPSLRRAKLLEPEKASIREALGRALFQSGSLAAARREFTKVVRLQPTDDYAHFVLGLACERTGQRTRARGHMRLAAAMRPDRLDYQRAVRRLTA